MVVRENGGTLASLIRRRITVLRIGETVTMMMMMAGGDDDDLVVAVVLIACCGRGVVSLVVVNGEPICPRKSTAKAADGIP
uniref:Uncharacterized protein n=1 Tax=Panagrellus redivivus TaxID=6233 RepID=A0A7E4UWE6_PANRE